MLSFEPNDSSFPKASTWMNSLGLFGPLNVPLFYFFENIKLKMYH